MADKEITIKVNTESDVSQLNDITESLDEINREAEEVGEALQTAFEEATEDVERLSDELAQIELGEIDGDFDAVAQQLEEAENRAEALADAIDSIDAGKLSDASASASDLADGLENANSNANDLSDSMGLIEGVMLLDLANQIGAMGDSAEGMAQEIDTASISIGQLATNVGMAEPEMKNLIAYISNVTFPQEEAMAYVKVLNQMGVSADKLGDSATNMDRINDATGMGADKVMLLTQGLTALGISADNLPESFNAIAYAEANVGGGAETLQQVLKRQAGTLNEYGMGVDATVVALSSLQKQTGLTGMKLGTEFSKRLEECNGDLSQLEQSLGLQAGALSNASNETGKYTGKLQELADEEMEHKTITQRLGDVWADISLQFGGVIGPLSDVIGLIGSFGQFALAINSIKTLADTFNITRSSLSALIPTQIAEGIAGNFSIGWMLVAIAIGIALGLLFIYLYENCDWFREAVDNLGATLQWLAGEIFSVVQDAIDNLISAFESFTESLGLNSGSWTDTLLAFILFIPQLPMQIGLALLDAITETLGFGDSFVDALYNAGINGYNSFVDGINGLSEALREELDAMVEDATSFEDGFPPILQATGVGMVGNWLLSTGEHSPGFMYDALHGELTAMVQLAGQLVLLIVQAITKGGRDLVSNFINQVSTLPSKFWNELQNMINDALNFAGQIGQILWNAGVNAVTGFLNGLQRHSPGKMQRELIAELTETGDRVPEVSKHLISNIGLVGEGITNAFNPNLDVGNASLTSTNGVIGGGDTVINIYGDVDSDKRVQEIVDVIRRELSWDNATAGRYV